MSMIEVHELTRSFGKTLALDGVNLEVGQGTVFGLVGENGAGKTTLVKHILGSLQAQSGSVRVFGKDPVSEPVEVLSQIGYLSEDRDLPGWMRVGELIRYTQAFYPDWDERFSEELRACFELPLDAKIKRLSRGQKARIGLLVALAYRPNLLLLDEPSSGLDAAVRRDILSAIIRTVADEGRTVFFSSHLLDEVEQVADYVAMIHEGKVVFCSSVDQIRSKHRKGVLRFKTAVDTIPTLPGLLHAEGEGREWSVVFDTTEGNFGESASEHDASLVEEQEASLETVFLARVGQKLPAGDL